MQNTLDLIVISDLHYINNAKTDDEKSVTKMLGREFLRRVLFIAQRTINTDALIFLGDIVDNGEVKGAGKDLEEIKEELSSFKPPFICIPGNHDGDPDRFRKIFDFPEGPVRMGPAVLYFFNDHFNNEDQAERSKKQRKKFNEFAHKNDRQLIVFQHSPVYPEICTDYPYNLYNREEIMEDYRKQNVLLSVSGHYHKGIKMLDKKGTSYITCPALSKSPFKFLHFHIQDNKVEINEHQLAGGKLKTLQDLHVHTQFAFCAKTVSMKSAVNRCKTISLKNITLAEHSGQLYGTRNEFYSSKIHKKPELIHRARENGTDRTLDFIKEAEKYKSECVKIGLEVDCALDGSALVLEEDRQKLDILLGAVHRFPDNMEMPESKIKSTFIELHKHFLEEDIDILAHPFRIFRRNKIKTPTELFHPLAELLYETGTAVELNFHTNFPAPEFFESCIEKGVKIGFGSDAHYLYEIGNFLPHIEFLKKLGITPKEYPSILY